MLILVVGYSWEGKKIRVKREKFTTQFISFCNYLLLKLIWEHLLSSVNSIRVIETTWVSILELASQPKTLQWLLHFSLHWASLAMTWLQNVISPEHDLTQLFSWLVEWTSSASSTMSFTFLSRPIVQPSLHIHISAEPHLHPGSVLQVSEDEVNGIHCEPLLFFTATAHEGGVSQRTDWCWLEFAFQITLYNAEC